MKFWSEKKKVIIASLIFFGFVVGAYIPYFYTWVYNGVSCCVTYPVLWMQRTVVEPVRQTFKKRTTNKKLVRHIAALEKKLHEAHGNYLAAQATLDVHDNIKELHDFRKRYGHEHATIAQVLTRQFSDHGHYFFVDAGSSRGIELDMIAVYHHNLIGRVVEVFPWYAKVRLITDPLSQVAAYCSHTKTPGIAHGTGDIYTLLLEHVSHLATIQDHDLVITSGEGMVFPRGFTIGRIVSHTKGDLHYTITVKPFVNLHDVSHCLLLPKI